MDQRILFGSTSPGNGIENPEQPCTDAGSSKWRRLFCAECVHRGADEIGEFYVIA
ncbi:hypothetical protein B4065_1799 [Caldibacillus thermoamylovorans]|uniref:Uncharacterized protein n=1 Tax=Caldibacillus thermoamylovorans TaxID=35841 RepID=A0ABD4AA86_9BACI|nr:hypothetical protein B4166_2471 [Caldibacillus thermoamylovorans]KIO67894.1 hypothetical protein B4065_1799 [Caldibacillus thermoamylovorans]KIO73904.1 hypothetical protein B4167_1737 [Caldibacillus thermoamylovorans]